MKLKPFTKNIRERDIEKYLVREVKKIGGVAEKFKTPSKRSVPDRLCLFVFGQLIFVECKAPGKVPTEKQLKDHTRRRAMGFTVWVVDTKAKVDEFIEFVIRFVLL